MPAPHSSADSPVMRQYLEIKQRYADAILMFRMGDFYEMFFEDAVTVGPILDIAVTSRDKNAADPVPMAGVPYHAIGGYLRTLVEQGLKVAICEQMESPEEAKKRKGPSKIVRRDVVRVVTPGALIDEEHLQSGESNYFAVVMPEDDRKPEGRCAVAAMDISCGDFQVSYIESFEALRAELARLSPREILAPEALFGALRDAIGSSCPALESLSHAPSPRHVERVRHLYSETQGSGKLSAPADRAAAYALAYAEHTQPGQTLLMHRLRLHDAGRHLVLDDTSLRNLEIFRTLREGQKRGSLLWAIDRTRTAMGARQLRGWLGAPLQTRGELEARLDAVQCALDRPDPRTRVQSRLKDIRDIVRLAARARLGTINPRELGALRDSLDALPGLSEELAGLRQSKKAGQLLELGDDLCEELCAKLKALLIDAPPSISRDGGFIRDGADPELDEQRKLRDGGRDALADIETRERESTGIPNLKVQHNRVFGYFLEVSKREQKKVPAHYVRKQTTANAERYVTEELAGLESKVLGAQSNALARELALLDAIKADVSESAEALCDLGERLATIDALCGLAELAEERGYVRPEFQERSEIEILEGRHPVVEQLLDRGAFVPNNLQLRADGAGGIPRLLVITGPNMGGKSTVMRQIGLIVILAQIGSFVPAKRAKLGIVDRVFTRVGAADDLGRGDSTFMVEMRETSQILAQAGPRSLVLLDEIGRGTATFDGLALAWAVTEYLHDQVGCQTLFATHYHELCGLAERLPGVENVHVSVHEHRGSIVFLHRVESGPAGRSYGIQVGRLAGLPARVLRRAGRILERLERSEPVDRRGQLDLFAPRANGEDDIESPSAGESTESALDPVAAEILETLADLEMDDLSPREAHRMLERWVRDLGRGG